MRDFHSLFKSGILALTLIIGLWTGSANAATTFYVATNGNDANAGTVLALPFKTIQKCAGLMNPGDTCLIRAGTYRETVTPTRSGLSGSPITFAPYNGERVIISGANVVSGFTIHSGNIYKAAITSLGQGRNQIFMGGVAQPEARFPNTPSSGLAYPAPFGPLWPPLGAFAVPAGTTNQVTSTLLNSQVAGLWTGAVYNGVHYAGFQSQSATITGSTSGALTVSPLVGKWYNKDGTGRQPDLGRGSISGVMNALDAPGEWVVQSGILYVMLPPGQTPSTTTIEAKARQLAFDLSGESYITIRNLEVVSASVNMFNAANCMIEGAKLSFVSQLMRDDIAYPRGEEGVYLGGRSNTIKNSIIANSAEHCLVVTGQDHRINNNIIHDCGYSGSGNGVSIEVDTSIEAGTADRGGHIINFNTIYNTARSSISMSRHGQYFVDTGRGLPTPYRKIMIVNNELYNANTLDRDSAFFYTFGTDGKGTEVAYNVIHNELSPGPLGWGVYLDEASFNFNIHHNLIWVGREEGNRAPVFFNGHTDTSVSVDAAPYCSMRGVNFADPCPQGRISANNTSKYNYSATTTAGLVDADFPGGVRFAFGANLSGVADTTAHSIRSGLTATAVSSSQINLSWNASTDNSGGAGAAVGVAEAVVKERGPLDRVTATIAFLRLPPTCLLTPLAHGIA